MCNASSLSLCIKCLTLKQKDFILEKYYDKY